MWELIRSNQKKSVALLAGLGLLLMLLGYVLLPMTTARGFPIGLIAAFFLWVIMLCTAWIGGEKILLDQAGARKITYTDAPRLYNLVEEMKLAAGLPNMPDVYIMDSNEPNAFAVGLTPQRAAIAVTTGLLARLNRDELQGVIGHEMAHIANRDTLFMTLAGVTVGAIIMLADGYLRITRHGRWRSKNASSKTPPAFALLMFSLAVIMALLAPFLARLLYCACSRKREYLADACGAQFTRYPEGLASALEKISGAQDAPKEASRVLAPMYIVNPMAAMKTSSNIFSTHPATADRIRILRGMTGGASLAAYEEAYQAAHGKPVLSKRNLSHSIPVEIREPEAKT